jgi:hypothetical protein
VSRDHGQHIERGAHTRASAPMARRPRIIPLSRLSGAKPTSLPISRLLSRPSSGNSASKVRASRGLGKRSPVDRLRIYKHLENLHKARTTPWSLLRRWANG